jgi:hypothetical protein
MWHAIKNELSALSMPETAGDLMQLLHQCYENHAGQAFNNPDLVRVEKFKSKEAGISNGIVSPQFWANTAFPLLIERYHQSQLKT